MANTITTVNPATGESIQSYPLLSAEDAEKAVIRAQEAYLSWRGRTLQERARILQRVAELLDERARNYARLMTQEMGKPLKQGEQEVELCAAICRYTAERGAEILQDEKREMKGGWALITRQPIGVILGIQPWNFPLYQVIRYSASTIMAGNATVLKHAGNVSGMALEIERLYLEAGLPTGVYQTLLVDGETASSLISHPMIRGVSFTGSDNTGKDVAIAAAREVKQTVLELGSNDAFIVLSDADLELAVESCVQGRIVNNGETCVAAKRFVVVDSLYQAFRDAFVDRMRALKVGDPTQDDTDLGPMAREDLREKLHEQVLASVKRGATLALGGEIPAGAGFYYPATVLEDVQPGMPAYEDELFGPVAALIRARDDEDALRIANDSRYGLGGGIFSRDVERAVRLARDAFDTGMVNINGYHLAQPNLPFGGVKYSGYGREHGGFGLQEFVNVKTVMVAEP